MPSKQILEKEPKYTFNSENRKYIFHTKKAFGKNYVFTKEVVDTIIKLYSNFDKRPFTMGEISIKMDIPKKVVEWILKALNKTHDSVPFSDEKLEAVDVDDLVEEMQESKAFNVLQKFEKKDWQATVEDAQKWRELKVGTLAPFERFLDKWNPPKYTPIPFKNTKKQTGTNELLIGASDWHYGLFADARYLYNQKAWNIEETKKAVTSYAAQLKAHILERNNYTNVKLLFLGDLLHTLSGYTDKGTQLEANPIGEEQLEQAFNSIVAFVEEILSVSPKVEVFSCSGNHSSLGDYIVIKMLSLYFKTDKRIKFEITNNRNLLFSVAKNGFLMEHGYSAVTKNRLPAQGKGRENYINNLFMAKPEALTGTVRKYYLSADQHHLESYELTNVEGYMFPTLVGGCRHADNSGYKSRPRQLCLRVSEEGVKEVINFYFD
mgnify:CR=1 FL=1